MLRYTPSVCSLQSTLRRDSQYHYSYAQTKLTPVYHPALQKAAQLVLISLPISQIRQAQSPQCTKSPERQKDFKCAPSYSLSLPITNIRRRNPAFLLLRSPSTTLLALALTSIPLSTHKPTNTTRRTPRCLRRRVDRMHETMVPRRDARYST